MKKICFGLVGIVAVLFLGSVFIGCAGSSKKAESPEGEQAAEQKGSLSRTFTLIDEQGRKSGTLVMKPFGDAELLDENGTVIKTFQTGGSPEPQTAAEPSEPEPSEAQSDAENEAKP